MASIPTRKALVINPDPSLRKTMAKELQQYHFNVIVEADNGLEAINILGEQAVDLVVTDIAIGQVDAWRLTRLIRSNMLASSAHTKVIIVSSTYSERIAEATAKEFEINRFIPMSRLSDLGKIADKLLQNDNSVVSKARILVIEDYQDTAELVERVLSNRFEITHAADGEIGLQLWQQYQHDIVLLDLMLPKLSGEEVLREIIKQKPSQSIVMMTAHGDAKESR